MPRQFCISGQCNVCRTAHLLVLSKNKGKRGKIYCLSGPNTDFAQSCIRERWGTMRDSISATFWQREEKWKVDDELLLHG